VEKAIQITSRHVRLPASVEAEVARRVAHLERFYPRLIGCSLVVEGPGRHHRTGGPYDVQLDLRVPGGEPIIVNRQRAPDLEVAIGEAFDVALRQLEDYARLQRGAVKVHVPP
jgi:ribosome-associated translation inhibitor RaiA